MERHIMDLQPRVRVASGDDISALQKLISQSYLFLCRRYYTPKQVECALAHHVGIDKQMIDDGTYYVAEIDGEIVGCGGWSKRKKPFAGDRIKSPGDTDLLNPTHDPAPIRGVFVHPSWARRGIETRIVECCERAARQANFRNLELVATSVGESLYTACGFETVEPIEHSFPYGLLTPAVRMLKSLDTKVYRWVVRVRSENRNGSVVESDASPPARIAC
jgi:N-acetylglutamate synthase-like GNAT family acetyltransferase